MSNWKRSFILLLGFILYCVLLVYIPLGIEIVLILNLILICLLGIFRLKIASYKNVPVGLGSSDLTKPKISIHIPICNEPVAVVRQTILAAYKQDYENFEIIVLYNNTEDRNLWKPIEQLCKQLQDKVRFIQVKKLKGYKAGALNLCRKLTSPKSEFILTVDADYILKKNALTIASHKIITTGVALIQFPQNYYNGKSLSGVKNNFDHYFQCYATGANHNFSALPTGTLTLLKISALDKIGGWSDHCITEDALLGINLLKNGYTTQFFSIVLGQGLMPENLKDFKKQRSRWIFGNTQLIPKVLSNSSLALKTKWLIIMQLTAWISLIGISLLSIIISAFIKMIIPAIEIENIIQISLVSIAIHIFLYAILMMISMKRKRQHFFSSLLVHLALIEENSFIWWQHIFKIEKPFYRTNKFKKESKIPLENFMLPILLFFSANALFYTHQLSAGCILICFSLLLLYSKYCIQTMLKTDNVATKDILSNRTVIWGSHK